MKKLLLFIALMGIWAAGAQDGGFHYKALLTQNDEVLAGQTVNVRFTVLRDGTSAEYVETHTTTTDANGIFHLNIGEGTVESGDFSTIDWGAASYSVKVELDTGSGYRDFGTEPLKFVPLAKYADKAGNTFSGDYDDLTNKPDFTGWDTDESDDVHSLNDLGDVLSGNSSLFFGDGSGLSLSTGAYNVGVGFFSLKLLNEGRFNVGIGYGALSRLRTGEYNVAVGGNALYDNEGSSNVAIGHGAGKLNMTGSGNIFIGYQAGQNETGSNKLYIHNSNSDTPLIGGDFSESRVDINGALRIQDGTEAEGKVFTSDADGTGSWREIPDQTDEDFLQVRTHAIPSSADDDIYHLGRLAIGKNEVSDHLDGQDAKLEVQNPASDGAIPDYVIKSERLNGGTYGATGNILMISDYTGSFYFRGIYNSITGTGDGHIHGFSLRLSNTGAGIHKGLYINMLYGSGVQYGIYSEISATNDSNQFGTFQEMKGGGDGVHIGQYNKFTDPGNGLRIGIQNDLTSEGTGQMVGVLNQLGQNDTDTHSPYTGVYNVLRGQSGEPFTAVKNLITTGGTGAKYGVYNALSDEGSGALYGTYNYVNRTAAQANMEVGSFNLLEGDGTGQKFGVYTKIDEAAGGNHVALYAEALKPGAYAGEFVGRVIVSGNAQVDGKLTSEISGNDNDMKAYAYGEWVGSARHLSANVEIIDLSSGTNPGFYKIVFNESPGTNNYIVVANVYNGVGFVEIAKSPSYFFLRTYNTGGDAEAKHFTFVVYKK